eukprot:7381413-Prymnesium_polylepis.2
MFEGHTHILLLGAPPIHLNDLAHEPAVVRWAEPARHHLACLDVVRQLGRAGQHIKARAWRREVVRLKGLERGRLGLPIGLLLVNLIVLSALDLVTVHPSELVAGLALPAEHRLAIARRGPGEVRVHDEGAMPALQRLIGDAWAAPLCLSLCEAAQVEVDVDELLCPEWRQPVATLGDDEILR